jgi:creatinine amidohydrolase/Fe(II)-dependent formamide hydrolase-like protein
MGARQRLCAPARARGAHGDHAGYCETSFLLAAHPELVEQHLLDASAPWYREMDKPLSSATATAAFGEERLAAVLAAWVDELGRL